MRPTTSTLIQAVRAVLLLACLLGALLPGARAEDIDIYSDNPGTTAVPNVLLVLDNAANFSASAPNCTYVDGTAPSLNGTSGGIEQCALYNVVSGLPDGAVNIGLMVFNGTNIKDWKGQNCGGSNGGCLAVPLTLMSGTLKSQFLAWVKSWQTSSAGPGTYWIKTNSEAVGATMQEAWAYYAGKVGLSGRDYSTVQPPGGCQKNFLIYIGNAFNSSGTPGDGGSVSPSAALAAAPGVTSSQLTAITIPGANYGTSAFSCGYYSMGNHTDSSGLYADEWARYMRQADLYGAYDGTQSITSYTIGLLGPSCKPDYPALLTSVAQYGGGKYFAVSNYDEIKTAILKILNEVQAVNSVFASASLPVSVNAQGTYLNQIYLGMFRPDATGAPRWLGNLKQYQFILQYLDPTKPDPNTAILRLGDANGNPALSSAGTGFISPTAVSFWTSKDTTKAPDSTGGFFFNDQRGVGGGYDSPDGELVEKGGVAQGIRSNVLTVNYSSSPAAPRNLYTYCPSGSSCNASLKDGSNQFATTNAAITDAMLNATPSIAISQLTRLGITATVVTATDHGFVTNDQVVISGASQADYNGTKTITKVDARTFTFTVVENPPTPAQGSYVASVPSNPLSVSSITRSGTTATVTTSVPHGYVTGQRVTITSSNAPIAEKAYLGGNQTVTVTGSNTFTYQVVEGPVSPAGSGTVTTAGGAVFSIASIANNGVTRSGSTATVNALTNFKTSSGNTCAIAAGNKVTVSGVLDATGINLVTPYNITADVLSVSNSCSSFTYAIVTTPPSPATASYTADGSAISFTISNLSRNGSTATALASGHTFVSGQQVSIGGAIGTNEDPYVGTFNLTSANNPKSGYFTYTLTTTPITPATGTMSVTKTGLSDRTSLINWVRGENNFGDEPNPGFGYTVRQSVHGDVLHSRPAVVNYGDSRGLVVFYGSNDGVFRAINGSQTSSLGTVPPGGELWGLVLPEHFLKLNRQRQNSPTLKMPGTLVSGAQTKDYFSDGAAGEFRQLNADGTINKAYLYITMRRGGRFIYALDVTDPTQPLVMWRISFDRTAGFAELGQSWSRPRVTLLAGYANPVLVFGAGYDAGSEDVEPPIADTMGRGIYVVDAVTGALVWRATSSLDTSACPTGASCLSVPGMNWSIPMDISFVDRDNDGKTDRFYAADVGGNVWRVDTEAGGTTAPSGWKVSKLAALGCATGACASGTSPRKFFYQPNVVSVGVVNGATAYDVVLLGSGDREHPLIDTTNTASSYNVQNRFYALKDTRTGKDASVNMVGYPITEATLFDATVSAYNNTLSGFYVSLLGQDSTSTTTRKGEKVVNAAVTVRGTTFFGTNTPVPPSAFSCSSNLGMAKGYALNPFTGTLTSAVYDGGGMPPSPVSGIVSIATANGGTVQKSFCVGCGGLAGGSGGGDNSSALGAADLSKKVPKKPRRTYWYKR